MGDGRTFRPRLESACPGHLGRQEEEHRLAAGHIHPLSVSYSSQTQNGFHIFKWLKKINEE